MRHKCRSNLLMKIFLCYVTDYNQIICAYITSEWIGEKSNRAFAIEHNIDESTVRNIRQSRKKDGKEYFLPLKTLVKICEARNLTLSEFFKTLNL